MCTRDLRPSNLRPVQRHPGHRDQQASLAATRLYSNIVEVQPSVRSSSFGPSWGSGLHKLLFFWFGFFWLVTTHEGALTETIEDLS